MEMLDRNWLRRHPLPPLPEGGDKEARGRVLVVGGAELVPGALRLTGEAALRAGAGKLQLATVRAAAIPLAVLVPEAAMLALPADANGEIAADAVEVLQDRLKESQALVLGPGMSRGEETSALVAGLLAAAPQEQTIVLDAAALTAAADLRDCIAARGGRVILTPHHGEMSKLTGAPAEEIAEDPRSVALSAARDFNAIIALKGVTTFISAPGGDCALFEGGDPGLATSGSGDVLAGVIGGLAARGTEPYTAAGWGVSVHGAAGQKAAQDCGGIGYLARDLVPLIPRILAALS